jgi:hypothetical protein
MKRTCVVVAVLVLLGLARAGRGTLRAQEGESCVFVDVLVCDASGCHWEQSGTCESEGEEEEGAEQCDPGSEMYVVDCEAEWATMYECKDDRWEETWGAPRSCQGSEGYDVCWWDEEEEEEKCYHIPGNDTPCEDMNWSESGIQCIGQYNLSVSISPPCQRMDRLPYPRGMVTVPNDMWFRPDVSPHWNDAWSDKLGYWDCKSKLSDQGRDIKDYQIGLAVERADDVAPRWDLGYGGGARGWFASASWPFSSFGQDECGPGLDPGDTLPGFPVNMTTYWNVYWAVQYDVQADKRECEYDWKCTEWGQCSTTCDADGDGVADDGTTWVTEICDDDEDEDGVPDAHCWVHTLKGWNQIDLRPYIGMAYMPSSRSAPVRAEDPMYGVCSGMCLPIIEVQAPIKSQP